MENVSGLETTFNTVYSEYDKWRPTYVKELYDDIFAAKEIDASSNVLEIGIGTGQATLPFLEKGCALSAIELGSELAQYVKQKYLDYSRFDVINTAFQDYECRPNSFDLVFPLRLFTGYPRKSDIQKYMKSSKAAVSLPVLQIIHTRIKVGKRFIRQYKSCIPCTCLVKRNTRNTARMMQESLLKRLANTALWTRPIICTAEQEPLPLRSTPAFSEHTRIILRSRSARGKSSLRRLKGLSMTSAARLRYTIP